MEQTKKLQKLMNLNAKLESLWEEVSGSVDRNEDAVLRLERFQKFKKKIVQCKEYIGCMSRCIRPKEQEDKSSNLRKQEEKIDEIKTVMVEGFQQLGVILRNTKHSTRSILGEFSDSEAEANQHEAQMRLNQAEITKYAMKIAPTLQQPRKWGMGLGQVEDLYYPNISGPSFLTDTYLKYEGKCKMPEIEIIKADSEFKFKVENQCSIRFTCDGTFPSRFSGEIYVAGDVVHVRKNFTLLAVAFQFNQSESDILKKTFTPVTKGKKDLVRPFETSESWQRGSSAYISLTHDKTPSATPFNGQILTPAQTPLQSGVTPHNAGFTPQYQGITPQYPGITPQHPGITPQHPGMTPYNAQTPQHYGQMTPRD